MTRKKGPAPGRRPPGHLQGRFLPGEGAFPQVSQGPQAGGLTAPVRSVFPYTSHQTRSEIHAGVLQGLCLIWALTSQGNFGISFPFMALSFETRYHLRRCQQQASAERLLSRGPE